MAARFWLGTLYNWTVPAVLPDTCNWLRGQEEICPTTQRRHYQVIAGFVRQVRLTAVKRVVGDGHWEQTRSDRADAYVWKEDTRVAGTQFELGGKSIRRNNGHDWELIRASAKLGQLDVIPPDIYIRYLRLTVVIIAPYAQLLQTMQSQVLSNAKFQFIGAELELAKVSEPGRRLVFRLTLKIPAQSGGAVIEARQMLSLMNFEEESMYHMSFGGQIDILSLWRPKEVPGRSWRPKYGLPVTWILGPGIQI